MSTTTTATTAATTTAATATAATAAAATTAAITADTANTTADTVTADTAAYWRNICSEAFENDPKSNEFVMFIDQCKSIPNVTRYIFETANPEFQQHLEQLQFERLDGNKWTLSLEKLNTLAVIKKYARSDWHKKRHDELKEHLTKTLSNIAKPLDITDKQRLVLVQEFMRRHRKDVGSVPFIGALVGCLKYQLQNKHQVVEWRMNESVLTQNNEEPMEDYVRLLTGVLGFQLLYRDDADDDSDNIIIDIDDEPVHIWRMNPNLDNQFIRSALKCLPSQHNLIDYQLSSVERKPPQTIFQWICSAFTHCLSFLH